MVRIVLSIALHGRSAEDPIITSALTLLLLKRRLGEQDSNSHDHKGPSKFELGCSRGKTDFPLAGCLTGPSLCQNLPNGSDASHKKCFFGYSPSSCLTEPLLFAAGSSNPSRVGAKDFRSQLVYELFSVSTLRRSSSELRRFCHSEQDALTLHEQISANCLPAVLSLTTGDVKPHLLINVTAAEREHFFRRSSQGEPRHMFQIQFNHLQSCNHTKRRQTE